MTSKTFTTFLNFSAILKKKPPRILSGRHAHTACRKTKGLTCGTNDDAMEMIDKMWCEELYMHDCSDHCRLKM